MLGTKIKTLRTKKKLTQEELADILFVSAQAVSKWENNISSPDIEVLVKLADYFKVSIDYLVRSGDNTCSDILPKIKLSSTLVCRNSHILVEGTIENTSHIPLSSVIIRVNFNDENNKIIDSKRISIYDLQEHSSKPFSTMTFVKTPVKKADSSILSVNL